MEIQLIENINKYARIHNILGAAEYIIMVRDKTEK